MERSGAKEREEGALATAEAFVKELGG